MQNVKGILGSNGQTLPEGQATRWPPSPRETCADRPRSTPPSPTLSGAPRPCVPSHTRESQAPQPLFRFSPGLLRFAREHFPYNVHLPRSLALAMPRCCAAPKGRGGVPSGEGKRATISRQYHAKALQEQDTPFIAPESPVLPLPEAKDPERKYRNALARCVLEGGARKMRAHSDYGAAISASITVKNRFEAGAAASRPILSPFVAPERGTSPLHGTEDGIPKY